MISFLVKTWSCKRCDYRQDFEPVKKFMDEHFNKDTEFKLFDIQENECPSCALQGARGVLLTQEMDNEKKTKVKFLEETDIPKIYLEMNSEESKMLKDGSRLENLLEKEERIQKYIQTLKFYSQEKIEEMKNLLEDK